MLATSTRKRKSKADGSGRVLLAGAPGAMRHPLKRPPAGPLAGAYGRFLELPVPAVLAVLWLLGALLLGAGVAAAYLAGVGLLAAVAIL